MQQVSAFARPQTVPAIATTVPKQASLWILNSWRDLLLYVGTPLLLVPLFTLAQSRWSAENIYIFVSAFGALGHHFPGMIRAYGDRALFDRFRWRFIIAPVFLVCVCVGFYFVDVKANPIILVVFFWGVWHGMMQTYGFCRIYDAKTGSFAAITRRLDLATCAVWFAAGVLLSSQRMTDVLESYYANGAPFVSPVIIRGAQQGIAALAILISIASLGNFVWGWRHGKRSNPVKMALLATSIAFWWYCNNGVTNILAGIALFEVFHDVQYLSIVWIYNRNRVEKDTSIGGFMRFVFRRSGSLIGLYVGLVFAYGSLGYFNAHLGIDTVRRMLTGIVAASGLLHFYYDGFIWKVREKSTRQSLGLSGGGADVKAAGALPGWLLHGTKWAVAFCLPVAALALGQMRGVAPEMQRSSWVVSDLPNGARQHYNYGAALQKAGRLDEAEQEYQTALRYQPRYTKVHVNYGQLLADEKKFDGAAAHYEQALKEEPQNGNVRAAYGGVLDRLGRRDEAEHEFRAAAESEPNSAPILYNLAVFLNKHGRHDEAIGQYQRALQVDPRYADARLDLGSVFFEKGRLDEAKQQFLEAERLQPNNADIHNNLGGVYLSQGNVSQAILQYEEALRLNPGLKPAQENLRVARSSDSRFRSRPRD
jgi:tetratricopeptide (TPR) repeat protein